MNDTCAQQLGLISTWLEGFAESENDSAYLCFLRLLADYRSLQHDELLREIERTEKLEEVQP